MKCYERVVNAVNAHIRSYETHILLHFVMWDELIFANLMHQNVS